MSDAVHLPRVCGGKVKVIASDYMTRLLATVVHKESGICEKCGAGVVGFASWTKDGIRLGVRVWFTPERAQPTEGESYDPPV